MIKYTEALVPEDSIYEFVYPTVVGPRFANQSETPSVQVFFEGIYSGCGCALLPGPVNSVCTAGSF